MALTVWQKHEIDKIWYGLLYEEFDSYYTYNKDKCKNLQSFPALHEFNIQDLLERAYNRSDDIRIKSQPLSQLDIHCSHIVNKEYCDAASHWYTELGYYRHAEL